MQRGRGRRALHSWPTTKYRHQLNGYLERVPSLSLASSFTTSLDCEVLKDMFPWRTRYPLSSLPVKPVPKVPPPPVTHARDPLRPRPQRDQRVFKHLVCRHTVALPTPPLIGTLPSSMYSQFSYFQLSTFQLAES